uniref:Uncharacterized protein n=1 Tax=Entomoneis paludosa TaxID=265537 RepID=A0A7S2YTA9_9STRA
MATVVDALTSKLAVEYEALRAILEVMQETFENHAEAFLDGITYQEFIRDKYTGIMAMLAMLYESISSNEQPSFSMKEAVQVNILEAVKADISSGHAENAKVGLALATAMDMGAPAGAYFEPHIDNHLLKWELGSHWVEAYISWNLAFVVGLGRVEAIFKLIIPSVTNTIFLRAENGNGFALPRVISLALTLMRFRDMTGTSNLASLNPEKLDTLAGEMGRFNLDNVQLPPVTRQDAEDMLFTLCQRGRICLSGYDVSESFPLDRWLNDEEYKVYVGFLTWFIELITGFGMEAFFLYWFVVSGDRDEEEGIKETRTPKWSYKTDLCWRMAQFVFPIFALVSFGLAAHGNYFCILTTVIGLWKFGFPESLTYLHSGGGIFQKNTKRVLPFHSCLENLLNGLGVVIHHASASSIIAFVVVGVVTPDRSVMDPIFILFLQHCFVMLRYIHKPIYISVCLFLEVFFEWAVISHMEALCINHWTAAMAGVTMLFAHWLFVLAGALNVFYGVTMFRQEQQGVLNSKAKYEPESTEPDPWSRQEPSVTNVAVVGGGTNEAIPLALP